MWIRSLVQEGPLAESMWAQSTCPELSAQGLVPLRFQAPPGSQASSRGEAKDSALLSSRDAGLLDRGDMPLFELCV